MMERGEIRWYEFGSPDKKRPVLILTRRSAIKFLDEITVAPITSIVRDIPTEIILNENDGMKTTCAVNFDHIQTVSKVKIGSYITKLSEKKMHQVQPALLFAFGFD